MVLRKSVHTAPTDSRRWTGVRDRAMLRTLLDTLCRVSELVGLNDEDVDLKDRTIRVMGKGRRQRELP
jgi:site-specific recombinase XerC